MGHLLEYIVFTVACFVLRLFPLRVVQKVGAVAGNFVGMVLGYRRSVTMDNLRNAFPEYAENKLREIARGSFRKACG